MMDAAIRAPSSQSAQAEYSQYGEDAILGEVLRRISRATLLDGWCAEVGAWDGVHLSNTCNLIRNHGYRAVMIECDHRRFRELERAHPSERVIKIRERVSEDGESALDRVLARTPLPSEFDLLSIDVDGPDYHIWRSLVDYVPKVVCIEFNPTIPNEVEYVQPSGVRVRHGSSARAMVVLAAFKDYALAAATPCNLIFVRGRYRDAVVGPDGVGLEDARDDVGVRCFVFSGYDGTVLTSSPVRLPWHGVDGIPDELQVLPRLLRRYPPEYGKARRALFGVHGQWRKFRGWLQGMGQP